jgi:hypothetical protein
MEDYALIGDRRSAALVARDGAIDWLCWPHFDSDACFSALLGDERHGCWKIAPRGKPHRIGRRYLDDTLILETRYETESGVVCVTDLMPIGTEHRAVIRKVTGEAGEIEMVLDLALRFDYGSIPPWLRAKPRVVHGVVGPDLVVFRSPIDITCVGERIVSEFTVAAGGSVTFTLQYGLSHELEPSAIDPRGRHRIDPEILDTMGGTVLHADRLARCGQALPDHAAGADGLRDWRYYCGGDDVIA